jgi:hypothetical protein
MLWFSVSIAIAAAIAVATWCVLAVAEAMYGIPMGRAMIRRASERRAERRFHPGDIGELDAAFRRVVRSHTAAD